MTIGGLIAFKATVALLSGAAIPAMIFAAFAALFIISGHDVFKIAQNKQNPVIEAFALVSQSKSSTVEAGKSAYKGIKDFFNGKTTIEKACDHARKKGVQSWYKGYATVITHGTWFPSLWINLHARVTPHFEES